MRLDVWYLPVADAHARGNEDAHVRGDAHARGDVHAHDCDSNNSNLLPGHVHMLLRKFCHLSYSYSVPPLSFSSIVFLSYMIRV